MSATFDTVAIVGVGLIGGSIGLALRERGLAQRVIGIARRTETLCRARERGAIDDGTADARAGVDGADLVVLCAPVLAIPTLVEGFADALRPGTVVTDVGSTKEYLCREVSRRLPPSCPFIGGHPMAGSERGGVEAARADLFDGATWVLCGAEGRAATPPGALAAEGVTPPARGPVTDAAPRTSTAWREATPGHALTAEAVTPSEPEPIAVAPPALGAAAPEGRSGQSAQHAVRGRCASVELAAWVGALGARPIWMDAAAHDRVVAAISHLPHVVVAALVNAVAAGGETTALLRTFIAGGFASTSRIASSPPELWRDICLTNRPAILATLARFRAALARFEEAVEREDADALLAAFADARAAREDLIR